MEGSTECCCCIEEAAEVPFGARIDWGRADVTPDTGSDLLTGHGPVRCGFFRVPAVLDQVPTSLTGVKVPVDCWEVFDIVDVPEDEVDELEEREDDELARCTLFRGMNIRATSSGFIELRAP